MADDAFPVKNIFGDESDMEEDFTYEIVRPKVTATTIKFETSLYLMLKQEGYFRNAVDDDPHQHIINFLEVCSYHIQRCVPQEAVRLKLFKYSLAGDARKWFTKLPRNYIATWEEMVKVFLRKWYPPRKRAEIRDQIYEFKQRHREQLFEAWERYKEYLDRSPNHGFPDHIPKDKFYRGFDPMTQAIANNAIGRCFMNKSYASITDILDRLTTHSQAWHSSNSDGLSLRTPLTQNVVKDSQEMQQTLAQLATNISLLTKRFDEKETKRVNVCENTSEDVNYVNNSQGGYRRQNFQGGYQNQNQWRPLQGQGTYNNSQGNYNNNYGGTNQGNYKNNNNFRNKSSNPYIPLKGQPNDQGSSRVEAMLEKVLTPNFHLILSAF
ncbi:uncharacterized protein LOC132054268 [Lycium ferocissimum]|uniref:uncharacterized protein LOC132054268 n=1 Tax=Lycium ferocissimum TaxID=112874 RepID=UPI00281571A2|nr:uncharacterized protein LOC132054268 [Lycium ferocissimum]